MVAPDLSTDHIIMIDPLNIKTTLLLILEGKEE